MSSTDPTSTDLPPDPATPVGRVVDVTDLRALSHRLGAAATAAGTAAAASGGIRLGPAVVGWPDGAELDRAVTAFADRARRRLEACTAGLRRDAKAVRGGASGTPAGPGTER